MSDWDAARYHRISAPQFDWGQRVIARLRPEPGERVLDLGCGTGRLTHEIRAALGEGHVVGLDRSGAMIAVAREAQDGRGISYVQADGRALPFAAVFDAVFSAATLHWIHDHGVVFTSVHAALRPRGRFVAQCGGAGNLHRLLDRAAGVMTRPAFEAHFRGWSEPWYFADDSSTAERLRRTGFVDVETSLEEAPVSFTTAATFAEFVAVVCLRHHVERLPLAIRQPFIDEIACPFGTDNPPWVLDYWRLNIDARKGTA